VTLELPTERHYLTLILLMVLSSMIFLLIGE
jgi:hypothetical protein